MSQTDIACKTGTTGAHVSHILSLLRLDSDIVDALVKLGQELSKPFISQKKLRRIVEITQKEQIKEVKALLAKKGIHILQF